MSEDMFTQYPKEHLLKGKQIFAYVSNPPKKPTTKGKIKPLGSQKVGHDNEHPRVIWLRHLVVPSRMGKC